MDTVGLTCATTAKEQSLDIAKVNSQAGDTLVGQGSTLPILFEQQVARNPLSAAIVYEQISLNYSELNQRANRIAHLLIQMGIGPEDIVALALPRSIELAAAILGILKSGAAYLPLDTSYPSDRIAFMLNDAQASCIVTTSALASHFPNQAGMIILGSPDVERRLDQQSTRNPVDADRIRPLFATNPAYVIYTSGSTGRPKGVVVSHRGVGNLAANQIERFAVKQESGILQFASISFDAAVSELFMSFLAGARLVMAPSAQLLPGDALSNLLRNTNITHVTLPPSALATMDAQLIPQRVTLVVAGEPCPPHLVQQWSLGRCMFNAYGPTETTVCATMTQPLSGAISPELGTPIDRVQVYVLDEQFDPVVVGQTGELYIAGIGLARGYLNQTGMTAERFLPNPFALDGARMYRTGDLVCRSSVHGLQYVGRVDHQIKVRGFRIEPGEIEVIMERHPSVSRALVIAREDRPGEKLLVGYASARLGQSINGTNLRQYLSYHLPSYMVPAAILEVLEFPLTSNGKIDRSRLPAPHFDSDSDATSQSPNETLLASLYVEILNLERVGIHESFFDLGGHSLSATRLISRIRTALHVELELDDIFDAPSVASLATKIEQLSDQGKLSRLPLLRNRSGVKL